MMTEHLLTPSRYPVQFIADQVYSRAGGKDRLADIYLPQAQGRKVPIVLWLHGGGWRFGDRRLAPDLSRFLAERGFAMVSIDYRLSDEATFPAPVIDVKTAVRWVRSVADKYSFDSEKIGLWGSSAGGHLAACAALSSQDQFMSEEHSGFSSAVNAVLDGYGPTDFAMIDADRGKPLAAQSDAESILVKDVLPANDPNSFESRLIGAAVGNSPSKAQAANPINYVRAGAPPFLIMHGQSDPLIPWQQSWLLFEALDRRSNDATLILIERLGHGFFNRPNLDAVEPGKITIHRSHANLRDSVRLPFESVRFGFDLVEAFFRTQLDRV
jgi:acetyl esterase/lipase